MTTIILAMLRRPVAQRLIDTMHDDLTVRVIYEPDYHMAVSAAIANSADTVLIEVTESGRFRAESCLDLCSRLREDAPGCRLVLMCPEQDELSVALSMQAARDGTIDDFLFYDASIDYIASKLLARVAT